MPRPLFVAAVAEQRASLGQQATLDFDAHIVAASSPLLQPPPPLPKAPKVPKGAAAAGDAAAVSAASAAAAGATPAPGSPRPTKGSQEGRQGTAVVVTGRWKIDDILKGAVSYDRAAAAGGGATPMAVEGDSLPPPAAGEGPRDRTCAQCGAGGSEDAGGSALKLSSCARCKAVAYCGKVCQLRHWKAGHKKSCVKNS